MGDRNGYTAKHVDTELCFWRHPGIENSVQIDFSKGRPEDNIRDMHVLDETQRVQVQDIRGQESTYTLEKNGFAYLSHEIPELDRVSDEEYVQKTIIPKTEELVRKLTGATRTITFAHRVRCLATDPSLLANNRSPAHSVHSDFTAAGALHHLETIVPAEQERSHLLAGRVLIVNVWRPLKPIQRDPLAVCDWSSIDLFNEGVPCRLTLPDGWNELGRYVYSPSQRWLYLGGQQPSEPLVFTQFDSSKADEGGFTVPHSAFVDPEYSDSAARESLEVKMLAFV